MRKAVVLLSGGLDSSTVMAIAKAEGYEVYALSFDYGQRHSVELEYSRKYARMAGAAKHLVIDFNLRDIGGSALTDDIEVPKESSEHNMNGSIPVTYVPARNTIFLSFALAWAETLGAEDIFIGANAIDYSGYPDCRPAFLKAFEDMANLATKISVEGKGKFNVHAPLINMTKADIIREGIRLGIDFSGAWSCYDPVILNEKIDGGKKYTPCLKCDSCILRGKGFKEAGINDPLKHK